MRNLNYCVNPSFTLDSLPWWLLTHARARYSQLFLFLYASDLEERSLPSENQSRAGNRTMTIHRHRDRECSDDKNQLLLPLYLRLALPRHSFIFVASNSFLRCHCNLFHIKAPRSGRRAYLRASVTTLSFFIQTLLQASKTSINFGTARFPTVPPIRLFVAGPRCSSLSVALLRLEWTAMATCKCWVERHKVAQLYSYLPAGFRSLLPRFV